jgi:hypothetical protein
LQAVLRTGISGASTAGDGKTRRTVPALALVLHVRSAQTVRTPSANDASDGEGSRAQSPRAEGWMVGGGRASEPGVKSSEYAHDVSSAGSHNGGVSDRGVRGAGASAADVADTAAAAACWSRAAAAEAGRRALGTLVQNDCGVVEQALRFAADGIFRAAVVAAAVLLLASLLERPVQERREPVADRYPRSGRAPGKAHGGPRKRQARLAGLRRLNPGCIAFHRPAPPSAPVVGVSGPPGSRARSTPNKELTMPVSVFLAVPLAPRPAA